MDATPQNVYFARMATTENTENPLETTCAMCGARFEAHPGSFMEVGWTAVEVDEDDEEYEQAFEQEGWMSTEHVAEQLNIPVEELEQIAKEGFAATGAECWCDKCIRDNFGESAVTP